jgi:hypothetical protein
VEHVQTAGDGGLHHGLRVPVGGIHRGGGVDDGVGLGEGHVKTAFLTQVCREEPQHTRATQRHEVSRLGRIVLVLWSGRGGSRRWCGGGSGVGGI